MTSRPIHCLILACGNTLRGDDGVGPMLAEWAERKFGTRDDVVVLSRQQWTPELAEDVAGARTVLFLDCGMGQQAGTVRVVPIEAANSIQGLASHHLGAGELVALSKDLYNSIPTTSLMLTVGAGAVGMSEELSPAVISALPSAYRQLEECVNRLLSSLKTA